MTRIRNRERNRYRDRKAVVCLDADPDGGETISKDPPMDILVVDENTRHGLSVKSCLEGWGCAVNVVKTPAEATACIRNRPPAAVIVDTQIPNWQTLLAAIEPQSPAITVVAMVPEYAMETAMVELKERVPEFIRKPIHPVELEISLLRMRERAALLGRLRASEDRFNNSTGEPHAAAIKKERLTFIRQIADSLSAFMKQIATDAQDGLRYFDEMPYFMAIHGNHAKVLSTNDAYAAHLGHSIGQDSWDIYTGEYASRNGCPVGRTLESGRITTTRAEVRYTSGAIVPVFVHTAPIFDDNGSIELVIEVFAGTRDIESMARAIGTTQQRYRQLFDAVPNYIAVLDRQLRLTAFNQRFLDDFGFKTGRNFFSIFRSMGAPSGQSPIAQTLSDGLPHQGEMVLFAPTGDQLNLLAWTSPITTAAGKLIQILVIFTDVTELRRLQDNLTQLGLMISTITHSLKGSLTGLDAGLYMIDKGFYRNRPGRIEEGLDVAKLMTERIRKVVRDILYYAKERRLETELVDAGQFAADVASHVRTKIIGADIAFRTHFDPDAGTMEIDSGLIRASLINILDNAVEACIEDGSNPAHWIEFSVKGSGDQVAFTIADNGVGMDPNQMQNIFKLFWSSKGKQGTGLGLFITNKIIQKHDGKISVASQPGLITTFEVRLPRTTRRSQS